LRAEASISADIGVPPRDILGLQYRRRSESRDLRFLGAGFGLLTVK
jgi:hypothetical protein